MCIRDSDNSYYVDHTLTLARHPSETDERMMVRLCALALQAHTLSSVCNGDGTLAFGAGLSDPDEPDVWLRDFTGRTRVWIEVGQPEDKPLIKACGKSDQVLLYCFNHAAGSVVAQHGKQTQSPAKLARVSRAHASIPSADSPGPAQHAIASDGTRRHSYFG